MAARVNRELYCKNEKLINVSMNQPIGQTINQVSINQFVSQLVN